MSGAPSNDTKNLSFPKGGIISLFGKEGLKEIFR
jgi:hypothetical protein